MRITGGKTAFRIAQNKVESRVRDDERKADVLAECLLPGTPTPSLLVLWNQRVGRHFSVWSLKNKDFYQSVME
jgi:hypothetical protein